MEGYLFQIDLDTKKMLMWYDDITLEQAEKIITKIKENSEWLYDGIFAIVDSIKEDVLKEGEGKE